MCVLDALDLFRSQVARENRSKWSLFFSSLLSFLNAPRLYAGLKGEPPPGTFVLEPDA